MGHRCCKCQKSPDDFYDQDLRRVRHDLPTFTAAPIAQSDAASRRNPLRSSLSGHQRDDYTTRPLSTIAVVPRGGTVGSPELVNLPVPVRTFADVCATLVQLGFADHIDVSDGLVRWWAPDLASWLPFGDGIRCRGRAEHTATTVPDWSCCSWGCLADVPSHLGVSSTVHLPATYRVPLFAVLRARNTSVVSPIVQRASRQRGPGKYNISLDGHPPPVSPGRGSVLPNPEEHLRNLNDSLRSSPRRLTSPRRHGDLSPRASSRRSRPRLPSL